MGCVAAAKDNTRLHNLAAICSTVPPLVSVWLLITAATWVVTLLYPRIAHWCRIGCIIIIIFAFVHHPAMRSLLLLCPSALASWQNCVASAGHSRCKASLSRLPAAYSVRTLVFVLQSRRACVPLKFRLVQGSVSSSCGNRSMQMHLSTNAWRISTLLAGHGAHTHLGPVQYSPLELL